MVAANPPPLFAGLIVDLDDTLVDTSMLAPFRDRRDWKGAVAGCHTSVIFPGVADLLQAVTALGIRWAVVTTSVSYYAAAVLKHHGLTPNALVAYHDATPKPSPASIQLALTRIGVAASDAIGLGGALADLRPHAAHVSQHSALLARAHERDAAVARLVQRGEQRDGLRSEPACARALGVRVMGCVLDGHARRSSGAVPLKLVAPWMHPQNPQNSDRVCIVWIPCVAPPAVARRTGVSSGGRAVGPRRHLPAGCSRARRARSLRSRARRCAAVHRLRGEEPMNPQFARNMAARRWSLAKHAWKTSKLATVGRRRLTQVEREQWRQWAREDFDQAMGWMESARKLEAQG